MPVADRFGVLDAHDVAEPPGSENVLEYLSVRGIAQDMADSQDHPCPLDGVDDGATRRLVQRHRFLQHDVVAEFGEGQRRLQVHPVLRTDQHGIGHPAARGQLPPLTDRSIGGDSVLGRESPTPRRPRLGDGDDLRPVGMVQRPAGVSGAAVARADDDQRQRCHGRADYPSHAGVEGAFFSLLQGLAYGRRAAPSRGGDAVVEPC